MLQSSKSSKFSLTITRIWYALHSLRDLRDYEFPRAPLRRCESFDVLLLEITRNSASRADPILRILHLACITITSVSLQRKPVSCSIQAILRRNNEVAARDSSSLAR